MNFVRLPHWTGGWYEGSLSGTKGNGVLRIGDVSEKKTSRVLREQSTTVSRV